MDQGDKRHEPTQHRRDEARRKGQIPKSQDLASAALLVGALLALMYFGRGMSQFFVEYLKLQLGTAWLHTDRDTTVAQYRDMLGELGESVLPFLGAILLVAVAVNVGQIGFMFLPEKLAFDFGRINPIKGVGRLFTLSNFTRLGFGVFKIIIVACVAFWSLWGRKEEIVTLGLHSALQVSIFIVDVSLWTALKIGAALLILALLDYAFQYWKHEQDLRMTDQEMQEEMRSLQGDPQVIARRRVIQRQLVMKRMANAAEKADAVVTNPTELAVAIKYDFGEMEAPIVVAKGAGVLAQRIRRIALEHNIPIVERKELARALYRDVEVNQQVPAEQYAAVAEVLKYVYELKGIDLPEAAREAAA